MATRRQVLGGMAAMGAACALPAAGQVAGGSVNVGPLKRVLAWADVSTGYQHDSVSHALAVLEHAEGRMVLR